MLRIFRIAKLREQAAHIEVVVEALGGVGQLSVRALALLGQLVHDVDVLRMAGRMDVRTFYKFKSDRSREPSTSDKAMNELRQFTDLHTCLLGTDGDCAFTGCGLLPNKKTCTHLQMSKVRNCTYL